MAQYILTTKLVKALELVELFLDSVVTYFRMPKEIVSNRGSIFISAF